jgi:D-aminopeptidase
MRLERMIGVLPRGKKNSICDVEGVLVAHVTVDEAEAHTGVTAIVPAPGDLFDQKLVAAVSVLNGFGKSAGLIQVEELGTLESPIVLTNTLSVGTALTALNKYMLEQNATIADTDATVNCVVGECNDGRINDIRGMHVTEEHVMEALHTVSDTFEEGAVGAGRGMVCFGLKGGIGSASRTLLIDGKNYTVGALVLSNYGGKGKLRFDGQLLPFSDKEEDKGSIMIIIATDIPLSSRQLKRVAKRSSMALGRTGSIMGHGSGDIAIAFSTANRISQKAKKAIRAFPILHEKMIDRVFDATVESVEEAIYSSLWHAEPMISRSGRRIASLQEVLDD